MVLRVVAHIGEDGEPDYRQETVELDDVALMFFNVVFATLRSAFHLDLDSPYDYFQYYDEDGYLMTVKTDLELQGLVSDPPSDPVHVFLKTSRAISTSADGDGLLEESPLNIEDVEYLDEVASGQFGTVYKVHDRQNDRILAVKSINMDASMASLQQEIDILALGRGSPFIVQYYGAVVEESFLMIFLEFMDAFSLNRYGCLPVDVHGAATASIVNGLSFLWSRNVIHRDIKPSNFLVNAKGQVKVADFGVSRIMLLSNVQSEVGTEAYLSPERLLRGTYSQESDVWSLGLSLCEMAVGDHAFCLQPFSASTSALTANHADNVAAVALKLDAYDTWLSALVDACLRSEPLDRIKHSDLADHEYLQAHSPPKPDIIAKFIRDFV